LIPSLKRSSWLKKITTDVQDSIDVRSIQSATIPAAILMIAIYQKLALTTSPRGTIRTIETKRKLSNPAETVRKIE
jgi:hypothetical protein